MFIIEKRLTSIIKQRYVDLIIKLFWKFIIKELTLGFI